MSAPSPSSGISWASIAAGNADKISQPARPETPIQKATLKPKAGPTSTSSPKPGAAPKTVASQYTKFRSKPVASPKTKVLPAIPQSIHASRSVSPNHKRSNLDDIVSARKNSEPLLNSTQLDRVVSPAAAHVAPSADDAAIDQPHRAATPANPRHGQDASFKDPSVVVVASTAQPMSYAQLEESNDKLKIEMDLVRKHRDELHTQLVDAILENSKTNNNGVTSLDGDGDSAPRHVDAADRKIECLQTALASAQAERKAGRSKIDGLVRLLSGVTIERDLLQDQLDDTQKKWTACVNELAQVKSRHKQALEDLSSISELLDQATAIQKGAIYGLQKSETSTVSFQTMVQKHAEGLVKTNKLAKVLDTTRQSDDGSAQVDMTNIKQEEVDVKISEIDALPMPQENATTRGEPSDAQQEDPKMRLFPAESAGDSETGTSDHGKPPILTPAGSSTASPQTALRQRPVLAITVPEQEVAQTALGDDSSVPPAYEPGHPTEANTPAAHDEASSNPADRMNGVDEVPNASPGGVIDMASSHTLSRGDSEGDEAPKSIQSGTSERTKSPATKPCLSEPGSQTPPRPATKIPRPTATSSSSTPRSDSGQLAPQGKKPTVSHSRGSSASGRTKTPSRKSSSGDALQASEPSQASFEDSGPSFNSNPWELVTTRSFSKARKQHNGTRPTPEIGTTKSINKQKWSNAPNKHVGTATERFPKATQDSHANNAKSPQAMERRESQGRAAQTPSPRHASALNWRNQAILQPPSPKPEPKPAPSRTLRRGQSPLFAAVSTRQKALASHVPETASSTGDSTMPKETMEARVERLLRREPSQSWADMVEEDESW
ncbi:hypothetical protein Micbo1qcDRAFT_174576 [Microdochium bolleyi]|uniref:Uncharacterized protein n=1 Tax=Microdochium bolleyi TaxID=196109 RepID=A0A136J8M0_9PEZI|nr:hypothetical protein Micbo1qcDRAFT_174576 [Microdochium bolleyi]